MSIVEEMRKILAPKKRLYCKRLQEPVITCRIKECEYFGTCTEQNPYTLPPLQHILVMNPPKNKNNNSNGGGINNNKVEVNKR